MREGDTDFSSLKTVSKFDRGESKTLAMDVTPQGLPIFSPPSLFVESLLDQLCKLFEKDPRRQRNLYLTICQQLHQMKLIDESYKLDEFQFMRSHYQKALYHFLNVAKSTLVESKAICSIPPKINLGPENILEWSRYSTEFRELEFIAKGGFGHVYKSQHLLDGGIYAIKKLYVSYRSVSGFLQNLREVKMLAKLNHPNIVAYKAAWLEPIDDTKKRKVPAISQPKSEISNGDSVEVIFEHSGKLSEECSVEEQSERSLNSLSNSKVSLSQSSSDKLVRYRFSYRTSSHRNVTTTAQYAMLFIQMQFCQTTLRQWLDRRNQTAPHQLRISQSLDIFRSIVRGVDYIHSQGIVHHDIKPSNIFVSEDLKEIQVGDFGLSCCLLAHKSAGSPSSSAERYAAAGDQQHQLGQYGTKLYAAPEQLNNICHPKSDIYSLGIVLLELIKCFQTAMERSKILSLLRSGHIPEDIAASYPKLADILGRTVAGNPKKRPTAGELLQQFEQSATVDTARIIERQNAVIDRLERENTAMKEENVAKDRIIAALRQRLSSLETRFGEIPDFD